MFNRLNTHRELYDSLKRVTSNGDIQVTSDIDGHVAKLFLFDFEQCGIHLPEKQRRKVVELNDHILQVNIARRGSSNASLRFANVMCSLRL